MFRSVIIIAFCILSQNGSAQNIVNANITLKVMSYNIRIASPPSMNWIGTDLNATAEVINAHKPDLVALQEVDAFTSRSGKNSHQAKELADLTDMNYFFVKAIDRSEGDYGVAVLSRYPIHERYGYQLPVTADGGEIRGVAAIVIPTPLGEIVFLTVHFDHLSDENRVLQSHELIKILTDHDSRPVIVGADLNMQPNNEVMSIIRKELETCIECPLTFPQIDPQKTYDYILLNKPASKKFKLVKYYTVKEDYASDHLPLIAEFKLIN